ncbi:flavodoxin domain-containing protein [uncultured Desulfosarcina sp.]|uniref:flavodoxin family protein n=1 Tax=uncultured Desulfosarcina sp. TaxID=218289 RepID=UPI0029C67C44|nr:flavodoxin domain-containing protein [uncultured Desulfosarcina sp.]
MKSVILYDSIGGNTEKAAQHIFDTLRDAISIVDLVKFTPEVDIEIFDYDLVFLGSPVIDWLPTKRMMEFLKKKLQSYSDHGKIVPSSPIIPGKYGICFCTYAGPHIGKNEALPMTMWLSSFLEHLGYAVLDQWHIVGQFHKETHMNTQGRLGNILGRPNDADLTNVVNRTKGIIGALSASIEDEKS